MTIPELRHAMATSPETFAWERGRMMSENSLVKLGCDLITVDRKRHIMRLIRE